MFFSHFAVRAVFAAALELHLCSAMSRVAVLESQHAIVHEISFSARFQLHALEVGAERTSVSPPQRRSPALFCRKVFFFTSARSLRIPASRAASLVSGGREETRTRAGR